MENGVQQSMDGIRETIWETLIVISVKMLEAGVRVVFGKGEK